MAKICPTCGRQLSEAEAKSVHTCNRSPVPDMKECPVCGTWHGGNNGKCYKCELKGGE